MSYENFAKNVVAAAQKAGATDAVCRIDYGKSTKVKIRNGALEEFASPDTAHLSLTVFKGQRHASVTSSNLDAANVDALVAQACQSATFMEEDPYTALSDPTQWVQDKLDLEQVDHTPAPDVAALQAMARTMDSRLSHTPGVTQSGGATAATFYSSSVTVTSRGLVRQIESTATSLFAAAMSGSDDNTMMGYEGFTKRFAADLPSPEAVADAAAEKAVRMFGAAPMKGRFQIPVFFDRDIASSMLGHFFSAISGGAVYNNATFLKDSLKKQVFARGVNIVDDPFIRRGLGSRLSDSEGVAMRKRLLIDDGTLTSWVAGLTSAKKLGITSTGHASGSSNLYMENGSTPLKDLLNVELGFLVTGFMGQGPGVMTGDYSRGAQGFIIRNGALAEPVKGMTISSNLKEMFLNLTPADDLLMDSSTNAPTLRIEGMTVTG